MNFIHCFPPNQKINLFDNYKIYYEYFFFLNRYYKVNKNK